eukprot:3309059-Prymnesium_polylepis.1
MYGVSTREPTRENRARVLGQFRAGDAHRRAVRRRQTGRTEAISEVTSERHARTPWAVGPLAWLVRGYLDSFKRASMASFLRSAAPRCEWT